MIIAALAAAPATASPRCGPHGKLVEVLQSKFAETRKHIALINDQQILEAFIAPSGSWTILVTNPSGIACVMGSGKDWQSTDPIVPDLPEF